MMENRDDEKSSDDSPKQYQDNGEIATVETTTDMNNFNSLQQSFRSKKSHGAAEESKTEKSHGAAVEESKTEKSHGVATEESTTSPMLDTFDIVPSPVQVAEEMEHEKGAII